MDHARPLWWVISILLPFFSIFIIITIINHFSRLSLSSPPNQANSLLTAVDVNIYTSDPKQAKPLIGNHENTEIGEFIRDYLDLDLVAITNELKSHDDDDDAATAGQHWRGKPLSEEEMKALAHQDHYHGDFKRRLWKRKAEVEEKN